MVASPSEPHSLGLIDAVQPMRTILPDMPADMISKATYAVTREPKGGSPKPTSAPVYVGHLVPEPR
jgi:anti-sigma-K factor RskA